MNSASAVEVDVQMFARQWLANLCGTTSAATHLGVVLLNTSTGGSLAPAAVWPEQDTPSRTLMQAVEQCSASLKFQVLRHEADFGGRTQPRCALAVPLIIDGDLHAIVALDLEVALGQSLESTQRQIQWHLYALEAILRRAIGTGSERLTTVLNLVATALHHDTFQAAATAVVTELSAILGCERVSVGFIKRDHALVHALSHSASFGDKANLIRDVGACMDEAIDQRATVIYPPLQTRATQVTRSHEALLRSRGEGSVCSVPFADQDEVVGAFTLERPHGSHFDVEALALCEYAALLLGPLLEVKRRDDRSLLAKAGGACQQFFKDLVGPEHTGLKLGVGSLVFGVLFFSLVSGEYRVTADATLEGAVQRSIAVPLSGFVADASARAGDVVSEGDILFSLDSRDLRLEQLKWLGQRAQYKREHSEALAARERARVSILNAQIEQADAQIALVEEQLQRTRVRAPFDSFVVSGDLSQSLGAPVERGEIVFEVAPLADYRVLLLVDERDVNALAVDQVGVLALTGLPGQAPEIRVSRITPVAVTREGRNLFEVEASLLQTPPQALRPGMQGVGKIVVGDRKLIWIWTHKITEWLRMFIWSWWP